MVAEELQTIQTVGRRKTAVARVLLRPGEGDWTINGRPLAEYFPRKTHQMRVEEPLQITELDGRFDIRIRVRGGGLTGQADAIRMGVSRALVVYDEEQRSNLKSKGLLTRDPRKVERKKPGRPKARKRFQFSKR
ncbi:MAG: 30S ribosomal protein S9 [Longimicrobiales bacterium]|jgi:small subunit ribosomal protein S9|nr:30S ribosomal protein S9 [Longimicrobiales bacterium]